MAFVSGKCPICGEEVMVSTANKQSFCGACGEKFLTRAAVSFGAKNEERVFPAGAAPTTDSPTPSAPADVTSVADTPVDEASEQMSVRPSYVQYKPEQPDNQPVPDALDLESIPSDTTPFLAQWKTGVGATIGGILVSYALGSLVRPLISAQSSALWLFVIAAVCAIGAIVWGILCFTIPPRRFKADFKGLNGGVSFVNGLLGGVFGCLWNSNLTKRHSKQFSHIVIGILQLLIACYFIYIAAVLVNPLLSDLGLSTASEKSTTPTTTPESGKIDDYLLEDYYVWVVSRVWVDGELTYSRTDLESVFSDWTIETGSGYRTMKMFPEGTKGRTETGRIERHSTEDLTGTNGTLHCYYFVQDDSFGRFYFYNASSIDKCAIVLYYESDGKQMTVEFVEFFSHLTSPSQ